MFHVRYQSKISFYIKDLGLTFLIRAPQAIKCMFGSVVHVIDTMMSHWKAPYSLSKTPFN